MGGLRSKWVRDFIWDRFGLVPPHEDTDAEKMARAFREEMEEREIAEAVVDLFHAFIDARIQPPFLPTVRAAILANHPWLVLCCDGCDTLIDVDLRVKKRHPNATIAMVVREVKCTRCRGESWLHIVGLRPVFTTTPATWEEWESLRKPRRR